MAGKLAPPGELFLRKGRESVSSLEVDRLAPGEATGEESSDSEGEQEGGSHKLIRKVSTSGQMRTKRNTCELQEIQVVFFRNDPFRRWTVPTCGFAVQNLNSSGSRGAGRWWVPVWGLGWTTTRVFSCLDGSAACLQVDR
ncbi:diacylglycerol kinase eta-like [Rhineura floridana]|uniref:diacylglycerol kinase eta-like n=1 Tax=Rhineura floridana TaxID=261503 RepID=UPI002AC84153|nr:diacylglycerol kinase eta-like [Rhineura floridana]